MVCTLNWQQRRQLTGCPYYSRHTTSQQSQEAAHRVSSLFKAHHIPTITGGSSPGVLTIQGTPHPNNHSSPGVLTIQGTPHPNNHRWQLTGCPYYSRHTTSQQSQVAAHRVSSLFKAHHIPTITGGSSPGVLTIQGTPHPNNHRRQLTGCPLQMSSGLR